MKRILAWLLSVLFAVGIAAAAEEEIAVRVGERTFTVREVQAYAEQAAKEIELAFGTPISNVYPSEAEFLTEAAEHFVSLGVMDAKLAELDLYEISPEEERMLRKFAQETYEQLWQKTADQVKASYPDLEDAERLVSETMESAGYTLDEIYAQSVTSLRQQRLIDRYCADVCVEEGEAERFYAENYIAPDREKYAENVPLFEQEVLLTGGTSCYVPEGYFYIKYIILNPDAETADAILRARETLTECETQLAEIRNLLADAALEGEVPEELRQRYEDAQVEQAKAQTALEDGMRAAEEKYAPLQAQICAKMEDGVSFEELITRHSTLQEMATTDEPGFPFHPDSQIWDERLRAETAKLEKFGDCTPPMYALDSVYIVCRMDDMRCGAFEPSAEIVQSLEENLLYEKQMEALNELTERWRREMDVEVDISGLVFPEA